MDVKYIPADWNQMKSSLGELIGKGVYGKGMIDDLKNVTRNLEGAESDIARYDSDGVVRFSHIDRESTYQEIFEDFEVMRDFTGKVGDIVDRTIDQPFYEDIDAFVSAMQQATISKYTTKNRIGLTDEVTYYAQGMNKTMRQPKAEVSLDDLLSGDNFYASQMRIEYDMWKAENPDQDFSQEEYRMAAVNMNAFEYNSIEDQQLNKEFWASIVATVVIVGATVICPPAGLVLGATYGSFELGSALSGKDWLTQRELGTGERWMRGLLSPLDIVPGAVGVKRFSTGVRLSNSVVDLGQMAVKPGLKSTIKREIVHVGDMMDTAGKMTVQRVKNAGSAIKDAAHVAKNKLAKDIQDIGRVADSAITSAKNITSTRKVVEAGDIGKLHIPAENTHFLENKAKQMFSKAEGMNGGTASTTSLGKPLDSLDDAHEWGKIHYKDWLQSLTPDELSAIRQYTGNDYRIINKHLRFNDSLEDINPQVIKDIRNGLFKASVPHDITVYRGTDIKPFEGLYLTDEYANILPESLVGKIIKDEGFVSTAILKESSFDYKNVSWEVNVPKGSNAAYVGEISHVPTEAELLFNSGQEMVIKSADIDKNGKIHLVLDIVK